MPYIDYKFSSIVRNGITTKFVVRFFEGDYVLQEGKNVYKRSRILNTQTFELDGNKTDAEIRTFTNEQLSKHKDKGDKEVLQEQKYVPA